jgi:hypothetical protein
MKPIISLLSALVMLVSCKNYGQTSNSGLNTGDVKPDSSRPVISTTFKGTTYPIIFEAAFEPGTKVSLGYVSFSLYKYDLGKIKIESGKIIACDPIIMKDATPFTQIFPKGEFPVHLAMAKIYDYERVAFSRIVFSDKPIVKWEFALLEGQKPISLSDSGVYCYSVDAGIGIFIDSLSKGLFDKKGLSEWKNVFITKASKNGDKGFIHEFEGHNLAAFTTGLGDGCYSTYIGFDKEGKVCQLLTDFGIVAWWRLKENK